jgi:hypothetical protein
MNSSSPGATQETRETSTPAQNSAWVGWLPIAVLPLATILCRDWLAPWVFMWALSFAIFGGVKWLTWWRARARMHPAAWRSFAYLAAWPGMDAESFLDASQHAAPPSAISWLWAAMETALGVILLWIVARKIPAADPLLRGWTGMFGLILILHFGTFQLIGLAWQSFGVKAEPIMSSPARSTSLAEFWGQRWNLGFHQLSYELIFRPFHRRLGAAAAGLLVFFASGLIHDLVISVPARAGYGLPTAYFVLQGMGIQLERTKTGKRLGLRKGWRGWLFTAVFVTVPVY